MKVLYAIQATGNGHISRANEIIPYLETQCDLDILVSGTQANVDINHFVKYRRRGLSFVFGKKGGIDFLQTLQQLQSKKFLKEIQTFPVEQYDLVINDFEPISAWACKIKQVPCFALSHQFAVINSKSPKPFKYDPFAWMVLRHYAPAANGFGFHFNAYDNSIFTPVIRSEIRNAYHRNIGHYTVYLPAYSDKKLLKVFTEIKNVEWHIFSRQAKKNYAEKNCWVRPINNFDFVSSFTTCEGIVCGGGFETPAEALFMNKKLLVIPMKGQYEQHCNAAALHDMGIPVLKNLKKKSITKIAGWIKKGTRLHMDYPDRTAEVIDAILEKFSGEKKIQPVAETKIIKRAGMITSVSTAVQ
jgi:uncharacterized protein (TIGR00661 family)